MKKTQKTSKTSAAKKMLKKRRKRPLPKGLEATLVHLQRPDDRPPVVALLAGIKRDLPKLTKLLSEVDYDYQDFTYRFYHQSFKVYWAQDSVERIVAVLRGLLPDVPLNAWFTQIVTDGAVGKFQPDHNKRWLAVTRPQLEAFFHARFFLEMVVKFGRELDEAPSWLPSGWGAVLYLYNLR